MLCNSKIYIYIYRESEREREIVAKTSVVTDSYHLVEQPVGRSVTLNKFIIVIPSNGQRPPRNENVGEKNH